MLRSDVFVTADGQISPESSDVTKESWCNVYTLFAFGAGISHVDVGRGGEGGGGGRGGPQPVILLLPQLEPWIIESDDITKIGPIGQMAPVMFSHCFLN